MLEKIHKFLWRVGIANHRRERGGVVSVFVELCGRVCFVCVGVH